MPDGLGIPKHSSERVQEKEAEQCRREWKESRSPKGCQGHKGVKRVAGKTPPEGQN